MTGSETRRPIEDALAEALRPFLNLFAKDDEGQPSDELEGLPDGHAFEVVWRSENGFGSPPEKPDQSAPWISAGQVRRARAALRAYEESKK